MPSKDYGRLRERTIQLLPDNQFPFRKLWVQFAYFLLRRLKIFGAAIGLPPEEVIFEKCVQYVCTMLLLMRARRSYLISFVEVDLVPANYEKLLEYDRLS